MPHRDPETGQYLPQDARIEFEDIEVASFGFQGGVTAAGMEGSTGYGDADQGAVQGVQLIDYDEIVDRNEELHLLEAQHRLSVYQNATATEDGSIRGYAEISTSGAFQLAEVSDVSVSNLDDNQRGDVINGQAEFDDGIDLIGRPLVATGTGSFYNASNGAGGGASAGEDSYVSDYFPGEMGRFHPRDELDLNIAFDASNIDDAGIHLDVTGQHVYGVVPHDH